MRLNISLIPADWVSGLMSELMPYFEESAARSKGRATAQDIVGFVESGQMILWAVYDEDSKKIYGHFITEEKQYPQMKMLIVQYAAMEPNHMDQVEPKMQELAEKYARDAGCGGIEFVGRPGWKRHAEKYGYSAQSVMYQKFFK